MLHASGGGVLKYQQEVVTNTIGPGQSKQKEKDMLDALHQNIAHDALRQSETDFPRASVQNGDLVLSTGILTLKTVQIHLALIHPLCVSHRPRNKHQHARKMVQFPLTFLTSLSADVMSMVTHLLSVRFW